ncbi:MAG: hypothetical protein P3X22_003275 [Thermoprotei archaeon]|nr:hypothetical protein [Thermoprotei archaeon]
MPRVERGLKVIPIEAVLNLRDEDLEGLVAWALKVKALTITAPSIVYVECGGGLRYVLGIGSLVVGEEPPFNLKYFVISRVSWVDGCFAGVGSPSLEVSRGDSVKLSGTIRALDFKDPVALLVNGVSGEHSVALAGPPSRRGAIATLDDNPVLYKSSRGYVSLLVSGEGARRISYIAPLISSCSTVGGEVFED